jgi:hypothetical protein
MRSLRLFQRSATTPNIRATTRAKTPAEVNTAIIAVLLWKKDTPPVEDWDWDGLRAWEGRPLVIVVTVVLGVAGALLVAELRRGDSDGLGDNKGIKKEEGTEELATGESVEESEGLGSVVVALALLKTPC